MFHNTYQRPKMRIVGKTCDALIALLLEWGKKSTRNLNKLFYNLFLFYEHELNILICVPPPHKHTQHGFSFAVFCYIINALNLFFYYPNYWRLHVNHSINCIFIYWMEKYTKKIWFDTHKTKSAINNHLMKNKKKIKNVQMNIVCGVFGIKLIFSHFWAVQCVAVWFEELILFRYLIHFSLIQSHQLFKFNATDSVEFIACEIHLSRKMCKFQRKCSFSLVFGYRELIIWFIEIGQK